jgi:hypothetical protein
MNKIKAHRKAFIHRLLAKKDAKFDAGLHNHQGGGALLPSQLGWGQHKADKNRISLFDPFKGGVR